VPASVVSMQVRVRLVLGARAHFSTYALDRRNRGVVYQVFWHRIRDGD